MLATHRSLVYWKVMMTVVMMAQHQWYPLFFLCYFLFSLLWKLKLIMMSPLLLWEFLDTSDFLLETFLISILISKGWVRIDQKTFLARQVLRAFLEWCLVRAQGWPWNVIGANHHVFLYHFGLFDTVTLKGFASSWCTAFFMIFFTNICILKYLFAFWQFPASLWLPNTQSFVDDLHVFVHIVVCPAI